MDKAERLFKLTDIKEKLSKRNGVVSQHFFPFTNCYNDFFKYLNSLLTGKE